MADCGCAAVKEAFYSRLMFTPQKHAVSIIAVGHWVKVTSSQKASGLQHVFRSLNEERPSQFTSQTRPSAMKSLRNP